MASYGRGEGGLAGQQVFIREVVGNSEGGWPTSPLHHCTARPQKKPRRSGTKFLATGLPKMRVNGNPRATIAWLGLAGRIVPAVNGVGVVGHGAINAAASLCK